LNRAQQLFLQRLLASHVLDDAQALSLWNEIDSFPDCNQQLGRDLPSTLSTINRSLKPGFSLEIRSVSLKLGPVNGNDDDLPKKYYSIVNCDGDGVSIVGNATKTPHELAFFRLILERMIEADIAEDEENEEEDDDENDERTRQRNARKRARRGRGCQSSITRMNAINLRTELSGPHKDKLTIGKKYISNVLLFQMPFKIGLETNNKLFTNIQKLKRNKR
jgi:hypothetical protein